MKEYQIEFSENAKQDLRSIISYLRYDLVGASTADKFTKLIKQKIGQLEYIAGSMAIIDKSLTGQNFYRKINIKKYFALFDSVSVQPFSALLILVVGLSVVV